MQVDLGVAAPARITLTDVSVDTKATRDSTRRTQFVVAVGVAVAGVTILLTGIIDGLIMARRARRSETLAQVAADEEEPNEPEEPEPEELSEPEESEEAQRAVEDEEPSPSLPSGQ
jgi:flagellar biosynthesis/type III secretory pathway M-ring protein FliF/YscJ